MKYKVTPECETMDGIKITCAPLVLEYVTSSEAFQWGLKVIKYWFPEESYQSHYCQVEEIKDGDA